MTKKTSTGHRSTGNYSTGNRSTGNYSTGYWSISEHSSGHFSTKDYDGFGAFNKPCTIEEWGSAEKPAFLYFDLSKWIAVKNMTDEEKTEHPLYETAEGYLKTFGYQEAWQSAWDDADEDDRNKVYDLPNFDADIFLEITGIDVRKADEATIEIGGKNYRVADIETALKVIDPV